MKRKKMDKKTNKKVFTKGIKGEKQEMKYKVNPMRGGFRI